MGDGPEQHCSTKLCDSGDVISVLTGWTRDIRSHGARAVWLEGPRGRISSCSSFCLAYIQMAIWGRGAPWCAAQDKSLDSCALSCRRVSSDLNPSSLKARALVVMLRALAAPETWFAELHMCTPKEGSRGGKVSLQGPGCSHCGPAGMVYTWQL